MKRKNVLTLVVFLLAIGSALASVYFVPQNAYSRKADVPGQTANCELRGTCDGSAMNCEISFDHDSNPLTDNIIRTMYSTSSGTCGTVLQKN